MRGADAIRPGVLISWVRMVLVRTRAWKVEASAPAARVRLWEITAQISHAESAVSLPEDRCVRAESSSGTSNHCYDSASICECIRS